MVMLKHLITGGFKQFNIQLIDAIYYCVFIIIFILDM